MSPAQLGVSCWSQSIQCVDSETSKLLSSIPETLQTSPLPPEGPSRLLSSSYTPGSAHWWNKAGENLRVPIHTEVTFTQWTCFCLFSTCLCPSGRAEADKAVRHKQLESVTGR